LISGAISCVAILSDASAQNLRETIKRIKPSIVGIGTYRSTERPPAVLLGTGFVVGDGNHVLTNSHVYSSCLDNARERGEKGERADDERAAEYVVVFFRSGDATPYRHAKKVGEDKVHDVAVLEFTGDPAPAMSLGDDDHVEEGQAIAFTGFPIGAVLGLHPVTHRGIISAITPIARPMITARLLDPVIIAQLEDPFDVFQLDATAYPGNSGSPLYDPETGAVYGILSSVFVKESKEKILEDPSGITYAIPIGYARKLLEQLAKPGS
jgi:S1-C subfamily serine protease